MYKLERKKPLTNPRAWWKPWYWIIFLSSAGMADGEAWTKKGAENALLRAQGWLMND